MAAAFNPASIPPLDITGGHAGPSRAGPSGAWGAPFYSPFVVGDGNDLTTEQGGPSSGGDTSVPWIIAAAVAAAVLGGLAVKRGVV